MPISGVSNVPSPDQLVRVRGRSFVVADIERSALDVDALVGPANDPQHLVQLVSVDDDAHGDELRVVWEIEPGAEVIERALLPSPAEGFDPPARLDAFLDAVRWGAIESADAQTLQSPFRSGIEIQDYQLDPVARAITMPRANLLIADDVGLGKTIEAGLVAQELTLRHKVRSILIVCPAGLQIKWRDEMREKFGLDFEIVDSELMAKLRRERGIRVNPWNHFPRLITSMDYLKRPRPLQRFRDCLPAPGEPTYPRRFDLLIIDEAHNVAPSGTGNYARPSQRTAAIRELAPHFEHKLFLTATPHNGYKESFSALLELLDDQRFARDVTPDPVQLQAVLIHRLKTELVDAEGNPRFQPRRIESIEIDHPEQEREAHACLVRYGELLRGGGGADAEGGTKGVATDFVLKLLKKRLFSSPHAFGRTLEQHGRTLRGLGGRKRVAAPKASVLQRQLEAVEQEEWFDDDRYEDDLDQGVATAGTAFASLDDEAKALLQRMQDWAKRSSARPDARAQALIDWLERTCRPTAANGAASSGAAPGGWNDERVIIFTEYRATQQWLFDQLAAHGFTQEGRLQVIYGGMDGDEREAIKAEFQAAPATANVRILLATDSASEGIDLQNHCHRVVHYDIPWNPNRLEQRNGRIDRHGQTHQPEVFHFVSRGWNQATKDGDLAAGDLAGDLEFLARIVRKVDEIRADLGKVGPVIADQIESAMLGKRKALDTGVAERAAVPVREQLRLRQDLAKRIAELHDELAHSRRTLHVFPENVRAVVDTALELAGQPPLRPVDFPGAEGEVFEMPALHGSWAECSEGLAHPHTGRVRPFTFDHGLAKGRDDVVLVHLGHRLVQRAQRLLRAEVWQGAGTRSLHRTTARVVPKGALPDGAPCVVVHGRILVLGANGYRLHEAIVEAGGTLANGRFRRLGVGATQALLEAMTDEPASPAWQAYLADLWPGIEANVQRAIDVRKDDLAKSLANQIDERRQGDVEGLRTIMEELAEGIRKQLAAEPPDQLEIWPTTEAEAYRRDHESLERRLARIPEELERETRQVEKRYADQTSRIFPVSATFLVPEGVEP